MINGGAKISIIGCGNVGIRCAYSLIIKGIARELTLVDHHRQKAEGEAMDLAHGAPYVSPVKICAGDYPETANSDLIIITAGRGQKAGETRLDLIKGNAEILTAIVPPVVKYSPRGIILLASNPVDILAYIAHKISGKPANEVIGSGTVLDSARLRYLISEQCGVDPRSVHAWILGEHGDSEFPLWSGANIGGVPFRDYCPDASCEYPCKNRDRKLEEIFQQVRDAAYQIIAKKNETSYGIGLSLAKIAAVILKDENTILPVSSLLTDYCGIRDVYLSVPAIVCRQGVRRQLPTPFNETELAALRASAEKMRATLSASGF